MMQVESEEDEENKDDEEGEGRFSDIVQTIEVFDVNDVMATPQQSAATENTVIAMAKARERNNRKRKHKAL